MQYMLLIYLDEQAMNERERQDCYEESARYAQQLEAKGQFLGAAPLHPVSTATTVRMRQGKALVTDGPFAETREQLGGFFLVEAPDLDAALAIAEGLPGARQGAVEIRPLVGVASLPKNTLGAPVAG